jgi:hypothetical protein
VLAEAAEHMRHGVAAARNTCHWQSRNDKDALIKQQQEGIVSEAVIRWASLLRGRVACL